MNSNYFRLAGSAIGKSVYSSNKYRDSFEAHSVCDTISA